MNRLPTLLALVLGVGATTLAGDRFADEAKGLSKCNKAAPTASPASWDRTGAGDSFSIALPSCSRQPDAERRYMHGGTRWQCGTVTAEVVWGMWGRGSFGEKGTRCTTTIAGQRVMVVRDRRDDGPAVLVWYHTGRPHEPIVSVWGSRAEDAERVAAIAFSGRVEGRK